VSAIPCQENSALDEGAEEHNGINGQNRETWSCHSDVWENEKFSNGAPSWMKKTFFGIPRVFSIPQLAAQQQLHGRTKETGRYPITGRHVLLFLMGLPSSATSQSGSRRERFF
jgi:hypothetical protein